MPWSAIAPRVLPVPPGQGAVLPAGRRRTPPTWAKNATPPPFAEALNSPKLASISWYKNHSPRKTQAGIRTRKIGKIHVRTREPGYSTK